MAETLTTLRTEIRDRLADTDTTFSNSVVDQAVRDALRLYNLAAPRAMVGTVTLGSGGREVALSGLTQPVMVTRIWHPYTVASAEQPPQWRQFEQWTDALAYIREGGAPAVNSVARVFYTTLHTLDGLDSAVATTFTEADVAVLLDGACGLAAAARARAISEAIILNPAANDTLLKLAEGWRGRFELALAELRRVRQ